MKNDEVILSTLLKKVNTSKFDDICIMERIKESETNTTITHKEVTNQVDANNLNCRMSATRIEYWAKITIRKKVTKVAKATVFVAVVVKLLDFLFKIVDNFKQGILD